MSPGVNDTGPTTHPRHNSTLPRAAASMPASPTSSAAVPASPMPANPVATNPAPAPAAPSLSASLNTSTTGNRSLTGPATSMPAAPPPPMTATAPATPVLPHVTLQPNMMHAFDKSMPGKAVGNEPAPFSVTATTAGNSALAAAASALAASAAASAPPSVTPPSSGVAPLSPSALAAAVAPSPGRANLRVVPSTSPLAMSSPAARLDPAVALPAASAPVAPALAPPAATPAIAPMVAPAAASEPVFRVLAVDDSPLMRTFLQNKLAPYGIHPEFAASGEEALFKISKNHYDLIFLDVMLPGMDGYDVCKMIKKNKDNSLMKVVMLTSKDKTFDKIRGTMAGCDGYLTKPVDEMKLRAIIERHTVTRK